MDDAPLHSNVRDVFLKLDPVVVVLKWFAALQEQNFRYQTLIKQGVLSPHDLKTLGLPIKLSQELPHQITKKFSFIQQCMTENALLTPHQIFRKVYPLPAEYYQTVREQHKDDPLLGMTIIYKGRNEAGEPKKINHLLEISHQDKSWREAPRERTSLLEDGFIACVTQFMKTLSPNTLMHHPNTIFFPRFISFFCL